MASASSNPTGLRQGPEFVRHERNSEMTSIVKMTVLGGIALLSIGAMAAPVLAQDFGQGLDQPRLCLRFDNKSLVSSADEGQDAYDRAAALGNRCFANIARLNQGVTIPPFPKSDSFNDADYYFLTPAQRQLMGIGNPNPDDAN